MLVFLSLAFLAFVLINGYFKYYISTFKGRVGERMLRRLRYQLVDRLLRFPLPQFRRMRSSEIATMVKDEVEPLGGFIGDAFVQPAYLISQAATAMVFILLQSWILGLVAGAIVAVQIVLIPRLRRRLLVLGRQRQLTAAPSPAVSARSSKASTASASTTRRTGSARRSPDGSERSSSSASTSISGSSWSNSSTTCSPR